MTGAGSGTPNPFYGLLCFYRYKPERSVWGESTFYGLFWFLSRILSKGGFPVEGDRPLLGRMEGGTAGGPIFVFRSLPVFGRRAAMPALFPFSGASGPAKETGGKAVSEPGREKSSVRKEISFSARGKASRSRSGRAPGEGGFLCKITSMQVDALQRWYLRTKFPPQEYKNASGTLRLSKFPLQECKNT